VRTTQKSPTRVFPSSRQRFLTARPAWRRMDSHGFLTCKDLIHTPTTNEHLWKRTGVQASECCKARMRIADAHLTCRTPQDPRKFHHGEGTFKESRNKSPISLQDCFEREENLSPTMMHYRKGLSLARASKWDPPSISSHRHHITTPGAFCQFQRRTVKE
jgi:hypothetical protein